MCGLFGVFGPVPNRQVLLATLAVANMERGTQSTGYAEIDTASNFFKIEKRATHARNFVPILNKARHDCIIGHTRHATSGKITKANAHPWLIGNLIGCHNGMVFNEWEMAEYLTDKEEREVYYDVDSQYLLHSLAFHGHLGNAEGLLNLTYWNLDTRCLVMQASGNPLCIAFSREWNWIVWSSEREHLTESLRACKIPSDSYELYEMHDEVLNWFNETDDSLGVLHSEPLFDEEALARNTRSKYMGWEGYRSNSGSYYGASSTTSYRVGGEWQDKEEESVYDEIAREEEKYEARLLLPPPPKEDEDDDERLNDAWLYQ